MPSGATNDGRPTKAWLRAPVPRCLPSAGGAPGGTSPARRLPERRAGQCRTAGRTGRSQPADGAEVRPVARLRRVHRPAGRAAGRVDRTVQRADHPTAERPRRRRPARSAAPAGPCPERPRRRDAGAAPGLGGRGRGGTAVGYRPRRCTCTAAGSRTCWRCIWPPTSNSCVQGCGCSPTPAAATSAR